MANKVTFKKGAKAQLDATAKVEGQLLITTDEHGLYLDVSSSDRIRISDIIIVENTAALPQNGAIETSFYYVKDTNALNIWNPTKGEEGAGGWDTINTDTDTGATSIEVTGTGASAISATYDSGSRKITVTVPAELVTTSALDAKIGDLIPSTTVKEYVDAAIEDISGSETDLEERVQANEEAIKKLNGEDTVEGSVAKAVKDAKTELVGTTDDNSSQDTIKAAKKYADEKDATLKSELIGVKESAQASDSTIEGAKKYTDEQLSAKVSSAYKAGGSKTGEELTGTTLLTAENEGVVYNASTEVTTDENYVDGTGHTYPAGTNIVVIKQDEGYKFDVLAGFVDLTSYAKTEALTALETKLIGTEESTTASDIKGAAKEAKDYAVQKDTELEAKLVGTSTTEAASTTIKGAVDEAKKYTDDKIKEVNNGLEWGEFTGE